MSGILSDMSTRLQDVLNCELVVKEDELNTLDKRQEYDHDLRDLVYALSAFTHAASLGPQPEKPLPFGGNENRLNDIFNCVHTHANKLLRTSQVNIFYSFKHIVGCQGVLQLGGLVSGYSV